MVDYKQAEIWCQKCGTILTDSMLDYSLLADKVLYNPSKKKIQFIFKHELETKEERAVKPAIRVLEIISSMIYIPNWAKRQVVALYRKLYTKRFTNGRDKRTVLSGLIYLISRNNEMPIEFEDLSLATGMSKDVIRKMWKRIYRFLNIKMNPYPVQAFVIRYGYELGLNARDITKAVLLSENMRGNPKEIVSKALKRVSEHSNIKSLRS
jgi:transcription initiation factor TFIIIB Brf1 subunit/transcription initiation factor TFIIB